MDSTAIYALSGCGVKLPNDSVRSFGNCIFGALEGEVTPYYYE
ncbi:hypothetical protein HMPREF0742_01140 [Rothia aeria F0184]|uniref:Uncharacterized protein n=1 Tax=Rothia aeria F0184 TaxID=888019 RepID=U7V4J9_9MICC|nr:hypothetical protein HMPREF0742_01140 [Rothia aeria F0184]